MYSQRPVHGGSALIYYATPPVHVSDYRPSGSSLLLRHPYSMLVAHPSVIINIVITRGPESPFCFCRPLQASWPAASTVKNDWLRLQRQDTGGGGRRHRRARRRDHHRLPFFWAGCRRTPYPVSSLSFLLPSITVSPAFFLLKCLHTLLLLQCLRERFYLNRSMQSSRSRVEIFSTEG